jgi:flagellar hook-associated protein 2
MPVGTISGIASGLDTEAIIDAMLEYESRNSLLIEARKQEVTNKMTAWNSISAYLLTFKAKASLLARESMWNLKTVENTDNSVFTATATASAEPGIYYVTVNALAQQHQLASQGFESSTSAVGTGEVQIQVGDGATKTIEITAENNTLEDLRDAINESDAEVNASIINDGSSNNPYRLLITANETGLENRIRLTVDLSGGTAPDFENATFDDPETLIWNSNSTSSPALGDTASYTGSENLIYSFTIKGSGEMTVGSGSIFIEWSDGTNSGEIEITAADDEVAVGTEGLKIKLGAGTVNGGDTFQVQTFAPLLQDAQDAQVSIGNTSGGGSPIIVNSPTNTVTGVIDGVTLNLLKVSDSGPNTLKIALNEASIISNIEDFVDKYNTVVGYLDELMDYDPETEEAGLLIGDSSLMRLQNSLHNLVTNSIPGLNTNLNRLMHIGITTQPDGTLTLDKETLSEKINEDLQGVMDLFMTSGSSDTEGIEFVSASDDTIMTDTGYEVNITQVATKGLYTGTSIEDPSVSNLVIDSNNYKFRVRVNGILSDDIELTRKTYTSGDELAEEIETQINSESSLNGNSVSVTWVDEGASGYFTVESDIYGSNSKVDVLSASSESAVTLLGFVDGQSDDGVDVAGTINGEAASGSGRMLIGEEDNEYTAGLSIRVSLTEDDLNPTGSEGTIILARGVASLLSYELNKYTDSYDGSITARVAGLQSQAEIYDSQLEKLEERLEKRREQLLLQFTEMENVLAQLQSQQEYFTAQLAQLNNTTS